MVVRLRVSPWHADCNSRSLRRAQHVLSAPRALHEHCMMEPSLPSRGGEEVDIRRTIGRLYSGTKARDVVERRRCMRDSDGRRHDVQCAQTAE